MKIVTSVTIPSSRESVWQTFTGVQNWPVWSPWRLLFEGEERFTPGGRFRVSAPLPVLTFMRLSVRCEVTRYENPSVIRWTGRLMGASGYHQFSIEEASGGHRLVSEEQLDGPLALLLYPVRWIIKRRVIAFLEQLSRATVAAHG